MKAGRLVSTASTGAGRSLRSGRGASWRGESCLGESPAGASPAGADLAWASPAWAVLPRLILARLELLPRLILPVETRLVPVGPVAAGEAVLPVVIAARLAVAAGLELAFLAGLLVALLAGLEVALLARSVVPVTRLEFTLLAGLARLELAVLAGLLVAGLEVALLARRARLEFTLLALLEAGLELAILFARYREARFGLGLVLRLVLRPARIGTRLVHVLVVLILRGFVGPVGRVGLAELLVRGGDEAQIVLGVLPVALRRDRVAGGLRVAGELQVFLGDVLRGAADLYVGAVRTRRSATAG